MQRSSHPGSRPTPRRPPTAQETDKVHPTPRLAPSLMAAHGRRMVSPVRRQAGSEVSARNTSPRKRKVNADSDGGVDIAGLALMSPGSPTNVCRSQRAVIPSEKLKAAIASARPRQLHLWRTSLHCQEAAISQYNASAFDSDGDGSVISWAPSPPPRSRSARAQCRAPAVTARSVEKKTPAQSTNKTVIVLTSDEEAPVKRSHHKFCEVLSSDDELPTFADAIRVKQEPVDDGFPVNDAADDFSDEKATQYATDYQGADMDEYEQLNPFIENRDHYEGSREDMADVDVDADGDGLMGDASAPESMDVGLRSVMTWSRDQDNEDTQVYYEDFPPIQPNSNNYKGKGKAKDAVPADEVPPSQHKLNFSKRVPAPSTVKFKAPPSQHTCNRTAGIVGATKSGGSTNVPVVKASAEPVLVVVSDEEEDIYDATEELSNTDAVQSSKVVECALDEDVQCAKFAPIYANLPRSEYPQGLMVPFRGTTAIFSPADAMDTYRKLSTSFARGRMVQSLMFNDFGPYKNVTRSPHAVVKEVPYHCLKMVISGREIPVVWVTTGVVAASHIHSSSDKSNMARHIDLRLLTQELELFQSVICTLIQEDAFHAPISVDNNIVFATRKSKLDGRSGESKAEDKVTVGKSLSAKQISVTPSSSSGGVLANLGSIRSYLNYNEKVPVYNGHRAPNGSNRGFMFANSDWDSLSRYDAFDEEVPPGSLVTVGFTMSPYPPFNDSQVHVGVNLNVAFVIVLDAA
ncbi:hypothetical protein AAF712_015439 [Marasmius tenuissimus]|uniref:Uncharacterized protein n=1 Tax=Marasmius tenuissimus TaxID=585030 RepID=A0ABR2ZAU7_9AGAR